LCDAAIRDHFVKEQAMSSKPGKLKFTLIKDATRARFIPRSANFNNWKVEDQAFANVTLTTLVFGGYVLARVLFG
jgi:hypothetical protein